MTPIPRLLSVAASATIPYTIDVVWEGGITTSIDLTGVVLREAAFAPLRDPKIFREIRLARWGWGIEWPNGLDYAPDTLMRLAEAQRVMTADEFTAWQKRVGLSNQETADLLDRSLTTIKAYRKGEVAIPRSVALACRAMERDDVILSALYHPRRPGRPRRDAA